MKRTIALTILTNMATALLFGSVGFLISRNQVQSARQEAHEILAKARQGGEQTLYFHTQAENFKKELEKVSEMLSAEKAKKEKRYCPPKYVSQEFGFSMNCPYGWIINETIFPNTEKDLNQGGVVFSLNNNNPCEDVYGCQGDLYITVSIFPTNQSLNDWFMQYRAIKDDDSVFEKFGAEPDVGNKTKIKDYKREEIFISQEKIFVHGREGFVQYAKSNVFPIEGPPHTSKSYTFKVNGLIHEFLARTPSSTSSDKILYEFDKLMKTVEFIAR